MAETLGTLFPDAEDGAAARPQHSTGILPYQAIRELVRSREIDATADIEDAQIQPASIDLRLGATAHRVRASFLPGEGVPVAAKIDELGMHAIDLTGGAVLEKGCVYIIPLIEALSLSSRISGTANPKSSTGRLDVFTRLITDGATEFDRVKGGYKGPLYAEISPRAFSILVRKGSRLNQLRFRRGSPAHSDSALRRLHEEVRLVHSAEGRENIDHYAVSDFWEPVRARGDKGLILDPNDFHILASKEAVTVPPDHAAEMVPYDTLVGEFRVHYAGFFDPGFGYSDAGGAGSRAVLEVRSHEVPFVIEDGQVVGRLVYERLTDVPDRLYGRDVGSSYQRQGLMLAKQFKR